MVTDIHCHFIPDELFKFVQARKEFDTCVTAMDGERIDITVRGMHFGLNPTFFEPARQVARMDLLGIDRTVISLATPLVNYYLEPKIACEAARLCNDGFAELVAGEPGRFLAWAFLPMQDPMAAAAELRRCVRDHGFIGGHVATNVRGTYHPVDPPGRDRTGDYELTVVAGYLFDSTINVFRMICSNFLDRYPGLKLVCAHTGGFSLLLRNRMQREVDTNATLSHALPRKVGDYLRDFYFDTVCFEPGYLGYAAGIVPAERLLLGSDAPFPLGEPDPVNFVRRALPAAQAELALSGNFQRLIGR
jgi:aminocarboxymuconate-semialdehyde decarboxylase